MPNYPNYDDYLYEQWRRRSEAARKGAETRRRNLEVMREREERVRKALELAARKNPIKVVPEHAVPPNLAQCIKHSRFRELISGVKNHYAGGRWQNLQLWKFHIIDWDTSQVTMNQILALQEHGQTGAGFTASYRSDIMNVHLRAYGKLTDQILGKNVSYEVPDSVFQEVTDVNFEVSSETN